MKLPPIPLAALGAICLSVISPARADLALEDCRIGAGPGFPSIKARCGSLERPEDPDDPGSRTLSLRVAVVPALSLEPEPDPFVPIAGGPGQSTVEFYSLLSEAFERIRRTRDIVLLDQRGTGGSAKLQCPAADWIIEGQLTPEETHAAAKSCLDALPYRPQYFTTSIAVRDLEALRLELGGPLFNLYGASYGTRVAQHYARRYPDAVRTIILDGVVPPQLALGPGIAIEAHAALERIFDRCAASSSCNERFPTVAEHFSALLERLSSGPAAVPLADPRTGAARTVGFGRAELAGAIRLMSYNPHSVALMPLLIDEAANGNLAPLASQFAMALDRMSDVLAVGMHNSVVCTEDAPFFDREGLDAAALASTYLGTLQVEALEAICSVWPRGAMDSGLRQPLATGVPVLLLSGDADPVTPPSYAELAAVDLESALLMTGEGQGHGQAATGCMPAVMARFVEITSTDRAELDPDDCLSRRTAMPFFLGFSGPAP